MKKKRLLFVTHEYKGVNGSTFSLYNLINGIKENEDIECVVLCPRRGPATTFLKEKGIKTITLIYFMCLKSCSSKNIFLDLIRNCVNQIVACLLVIYLCFSKYDLVISNSVAVDVGANASRWSKKRHLQYVREFVKEDFNCEFLNPKQFKKNIEYSDYVVYISKAIESKYENLYHTKMKLTIHNGIKIDDYYVKEHRLFKNDKLSVIQVGSVTEGKGVWNTLFAAKEMIKNGCTDFKISFVGKVTSEIEEEINEFIKNNGLEENIELKGYCTNIKQIMANSDVLIMNSELEGLGRVTIEGMLAGCLVLGKATGGTLELISDGYSGYLFDDNLTLAKILSSIVKTKEKKEYIEIAKRGQQNMLKEFDHIKMAKKFLAFLNV